MVFNDTGGEGGGFIFRKNWIILSSDKGITAVFATNSDFIILISMQPNVGRPLIFQNINSARSISLEFEISKVYSIR